MDTVKISNRTIGAHAPAYIIAEMSANHGQDIGHAEKVIRAMKDAGADAVKLQTYTADTMTIDCNSELFTVGAGTLWAGRTLYDLYQEASMPWEWQPKLKEIAEDLGMDLFSTPFDETAVDFLEQMHVPAYKVASFELTDLPLIEKIAKTGKPMIISTGMGNTEEIAEALQTAHAAGNMQTALLKCTSAYPAQPSEMHLATIKDMQKRFQVPVGLSDHSMAVEVPCTAVALGACIIEKHFALSRNEGGPDSAFSLEPHEFRAMVDAVRTTESNPPATGSLDAVLLGNVQYGVSGEDKKSIAFRRSVFVVQDMRAGELFTTENVRRIRPGNGMPPKELPNILGRPAATDVKRGTPLTQELIG